MANIIKYEAKDGQTVELTFDTIKRYLVHGKPELVTNQEMIFFIGICKARGLNPFAKDCYLIKYSNDPAAIVTSIDYFRAQAKSKRDCQGWESGIIVEDPDGNIRYSKGLIKKNETLLGGWFKARPKGWDHDFDLEVNLAGYIKRKQDGSITKFWQPENQPTMIRKVAESQGLREIWPDEFAKLYVEEEVDRTEMRDNIFGLDMDKAEEKTENGKDLYGIKEVPDFNPPITEDRGKKLMEAQIKLDEKRKGFIDEKTAFREQWVNLKSAGYSTYVHRNFRLIEEMGRKYPDLYGEMTEKWIKIYPKTPWPLVEQAENPPQDDIPNIKDPPPLAVNEEKELGEMMDHTPQDETLPENEELPPRMMRQRPNMTQAEAISAGILKRKAEEKQLTGFVRCPKEENRARPAIKCCDYGKKEQCQPYQEHLHEMAG